MGTGAYIAIQKADGSCEGFYEHFDGYPTGVGRDLIINDYALNGDIHDVQKALSTDEDIEQFSHWSGAFNKGSEMYCDYFYLRRGSQWKCIGYFKKDLQLKPVVDVIIDEFKTYINELEEKEHSRHSVYVGGFEEEY